MLLCSMDKSEENDDLILTERATVPVDPKIGFAKSFEVATSPNE